MNFPQLLKPITAGVCGLALTVAAHADTTRRVLPERTIMILGDSLASGYGVSSEEAYPALVQKHIRELGLNCQVVNAGINGSTTTDGRKRVSALFSRRKIDVLVIALGGNDFLRGVDAATIKGNLTAIIEQARQRNPLIQCVLAGMELPPHVAGEYAQNFNQLFAEVATKTGCVFVPRFLNGVMGVPGMTLPDRIHPTAAGQRLLAEHLLSTLKPLLQGG